jgi:hypothetical protein
MEQLVDATWSEFAAAEPALASHGRRLLYQFGTGLAFLATTRADGGPRTHPVCPALVRDGLYVFVIGDSPKRRDLSRDGRYALHTIPAPADDESFYCTGRAEEVLDAALRADCAAAVVHHVEPGEVLFHLRVGRVLHTRWLEPRTPTTRPVHARWRAGR